MIRLVLAMLVVLVAAPGPVASPGPDWLDLARLGWNYRLREPPRGRDLSVPVTISPRALSGAALCIIGEAPRPETLAVLDSFRALIRHAFGKPLPMRYAGPAARDCGVGRTVVLRLYSGRPPNRALSQDLERLDAAYDLGLPPGRFYAAMSPAMAQTFFGRRGQVTHMLVEQAERPVPRPLEQQFYRSILIEELYQAFTFGADILVGDRKAVFQSKLQEMPVNLTRLPWGSPEFMRTMLKVTPGALCPFDLFMLHAVARAPVEQTTDPDFVSYVGANFGELAMLADRTLSDARFALIVDPQCRRGPHGE